ncbi:hypothetical protein IE53DRAFT_409041 [Violaceomyces palustris]|uniref:Uncharacterized protein n=1 Tax=Violaceomyces palustris TaxID=1673888 RepID=A0ACD0P4K0_9BASI|nr:hypothetical protein IE53DRAFT_409041 [Violaceomyces palustris]
MRILWRFLLFNLAAMVVLSLVMGTHGMEIARVRSSGEQVGASSLYKIDVDPLVLVSALNRSQEVREHHKEFLDNVKRMAIQEAQDEARRIQTDIEGRKGEMKEAKAKVEKLVRKFEKESQKASSSGAKASS